MLKYSLHVVYQPVENEAPIVTEIPVGQYIIQASKKKSEINFTIIDNYNKNNARLAVDVAQW